MSNIVRDEEKLYLIKFQLWNDVQYQVIYVLMAYGDEDRPILINNNVIFFTEPSLAFAVLASATDDFKRLGPPPTQVSMTCDIPEMIRLIEKEDIDEQSTILNCLNTIFDLLEALQINVPDDKKDMLYRFADHLTFNRDFSEFLKEKQFDRGKMMHSISWCIRVVFTRSKVYSAQGWLPSSTVLLNSHM